MNENFPKKNPLSLQIDLSKFEHLSDSDKNAATQMPPMTTFFKDGMKRLLRNPLAMLSIVLILLLILLIIFGNTICPYKYDKIISIDGVRDVTAQNLGPFQYSENEKIAMSKGAKIFPHIFGTDEICRDYFARVISGTEISLFIGIFASLLVLFIGLIYGSIAGYFGGKVDMIMMRICDIIYSLPEMLVVILLSVVLNPLLKNSMTGVFADLGVNMISLFIVFGLLYWVGMARLVRGQILSIRKNEYIQEAQLIHTPTTRVIIKHILPNCFSIICVATALQIPSAIFTESFLSFVGLGVQIPLSSLGSLANEARITMAMYPSRLIIPAVIIAIIVLSFNLLGDGLRDAFDPKAKK